MTIILDGTNGVSGVDGSATTPAIQGNDTNTGVFFPAADTVALATGGSERVRVDSSGNVGVGVTPSAWGAGSAIQLADTQSYSRYGMVRNAYYDGAAYRYTTSAPAGLYQQSSNEHIWYRAASGTAGNTISFTQAMTLDASGNLLVGATTSPGSPNAQIVAGGTTDPGIQLASTSNGGGLILGAPGGGISLFTYTGAIGSESYSERARIDSSGNFFVAKTSDTDGGVGFTAHSAGYIRVVRSGSTVGVFNRLINDGNLVEFQQDSVLEGAISVSGNTVTYGSFSGSHWSQLADGSKPEILRGTVLESINELVEWPNEPTSERLCRVKISDTAGSKKVYGVFLCWDDDWTATNDMLVTSVGAFVCRVNGAVVVQEGDLLESNGDGTARVQADDIMRSSTIGKVTSTVKTHQYDDGSYCVPTVLYCG